MDWREGKTSHERQLHMLEEQLACDFKFVFTSEKKELGVHKSILYSKSPVLENLIENSSQCVISDATYDIFKLFIRFLYGGDVGMNRANAEGLLRLSSKYELHELTQVITEYYTSILNYHNCLQLFAIAREYAIDKLEIAAFDLIVKDVNRCLTDDEFIHLPFDCLGIILNSDHFSTREENIFEAVVRWSEERCRKQSLDVTPENQRKALGDLLYLIRLPLMNRKYFSDYVLETHLLNAEEGLSVLRYITSKGNVDKSDLKFPTRKRHGQFIGGIYNPPTRLCQRLSPSDEDKRSWNYNGKLYDVIDFVVSKPIVLKGLLLYGPHKGCCADYKLRYSVSDSEYVLRQGNAITSLDVTDDVDTHSGHFYLPSSVDLSDNKKYTIALCLEGPDSKYGSNGSSCMTVDGVIFEFFNNENSLNGTGVTEGQIPGILFSKQQIKNTGDIDISKND